MAPEVADRVFRLGAELVNWYIVEDGGSLMLIDAGNPKQFDQLPAALSSLGKSLGDIEAIVLTHAHGDHLGSSARIKAGSGAGVYVHSGDEALARGEAHREFERHFVRDLTRFYAWKSLWFFMRGGATKAPPVTELSVFGDGEVLDLPGRPQVIHTPGHTDGSCCLSLPDRGVLFSGDALVTLNIVTGKTGPRVMPGSFNKDSAQSLESLAQLKGVPADVVLPGHGESWHDGVADAVSLALNTGPG